jgi:nitrile hydratase subunit beta
MDGTHDLGGRQGFGRVGADEPEEAFHSDWEARMFGMARTMKRPATWNIDWWRHSRELIDPADYLLRNYFDQWMQTYSALLVDDGLATVEELASGHAKSRGHSLGAPMTGPEAQKAVHRPFRYDRPSNRMPLYTVGQGVRAKALGTPGHTRLPGYARGRAGRIAHLRGHHVLPDASARGQEHAEPLYTVAFAAAELWPEAAHSKDEVMIDLWESYLEPL